MKYLEISPVNLLIVYKRFIGFFILFVLKILLILQQNNNSLNERKDFLEIFIKSPISS